MPSKLSTLLPQQTPASITQHTGRLTASALDKIEHLIVALPEKAGDSVWKQFPEASRIRALQRRRKPGKLLNTRLHNTANTGVSVALLEKAGTGSSLPAAFAQQSFAGKLAADALQDNPASVAILVAGFEPQLAEELAQNLLLAIAAHSFAMPSFTSKPKPLPRLRKLHMFGLHQRLDLQRNQAEASALNLARWLTALPPNKLDTIGYKNCVKSLARQYGWQQEFLDEKKLKRLNAGAFLAVAQGNACRDAGIIHIRYRPTGTTKGTVPRFSLVGKGIIFDTGGTNLKPFKAMLDMHCDMAGSAVALATLCALSEVKYPHAVDCWLAITENRISAKAYKSRDIVTASNGTTIEVIHTDAEGRMALADTLALASRAAPEGIIDFATLTGSCVAALTDRFSGIFSNRPAVLPVLTDAGIRSGERVWPFPLDDDFDEDIDSEVADVLQCAASGGGDHIQAARFLQKFVAPDAVWVHIDLSAATRKGGLAQVPTEVTGFGVRYALSLILDNSSALLSAGKS